MIFARSSIPRAVIFIPEVREANGMTVQNDNALDVSHDW